MSITSPGDTMFAVMPRSAELGGDREVPRLEGCLGRPVRAGPLCRRDRADRDHASVVGQPWREGCGHEHGGDEVQVEVGPPGGGQSSKIAGLGRLNCRSALPPALFTNTSTPLGADRARPPQRPGRMRRRPRPRRRSEPGERGVEPFPASAGDHDSSPASTNPRAVARPMPLDPPVTITVRVIPRSNSISANVNP